MLNVLADGKACLIGLRCACMHLGFVQALTKERRTGLYDFHVSHGGKMVLFGGWTMPLHYEGGGGQGVYSLYQFSGLGW